MKKFRFSISTKNGTSFQITVEALNPEMGLFSAMKKMAEKNIAAGDMFSWYEL